MECWICQHGIQTDAEEVGTCIICHIFACDDHGDRPTKGRFWCFVCLQRVALNAAGYPDLATAAAVDADVIAEEPLPALTETEISTLRSRLDLVTLEDEMAVSSRDSAAELARALAERCAGSLEVERLQADPRIHDVIDPRLIDAIGRR